MNLEDLVTDYLNHIYVVEQKSLKTKESYKQELSKYTKYLQDNSIELSSINNQVLSDYLVFLSNKGYKSINHALTAIRSFHEYINRYQPELLSFTVQIKGKKASKHLPTFLTKEEMDLLLANCDNLLDKTLMTTLYASGMRVSEIINLKLNSVNLQHGFVRCLGKREKERIIPLFPDAVKQIENYLKERSNNNQAGNSPYLFINNKGKSLSRQYLYKMVKDNCHKNGIEKSISPHSLRHTFASLMLNNGADLRTIQELLGHSDISTTQIYTHLQTSRLKSAYEKFHPGNNFTEIEEE